MQQDWRLRNFCSELNVSASLSVSVHPAVEVMNSVHCTDHYRVHNSGVRITTCSISLRATDRETASVYVFYLPLRTKAGLMWLRFKGFTISLFSKSEALILEFLRVRNKRDFLRCRGERKLPSLLANNTLMNCTKTLDGIAWQLIKTGFILLEIGLPEDTQVKRQLIGVQVTLN
jgi:hypothetical protein